MLCTKFDGVKFKLPSSDIFGAQINHLFFLEERFGKKIADRRYGDPAFVRTKFIDKIAAFEKKRPVGNFVQPPFQELAAYPREKSRKRSNCAADHKIEFTVRLFGANMLRGNVFQLQRFRHGIHHFEFFSDGVDKSETGFGKKNRQRYSRKAAARAHIEHFGAGSEFDDFGYGQRMQYMMLVKRVNIFSRNNVDAVVPFGIQFPQLGKLLRLPCLKLREIFIDDGYDESED